MEWKDGNQAAKETQEHFTLCASEKSWLAPTKTPDDSPATPAKYYVLRTVWALLHFVCLTVIVLSLLRARFILLSAVVMAAQASLTPFPTDSDRVTLSIRHLWLIRSSIIPSIILLSYWKREYTSKTCLSVSSTISTSRAKRVIIVVESVKILPKASTTANHLRKKRYPPAFWTIFCPHMSSCIQRACVDLSHLLSHMHLLSSGVSLLPNCLLIWYSFVSWLATISNGRMSDMARAELVLLFVLICQQFWRSLICASYASLVAQCTL